VSRTAHNCAEEATRRVSRGKRRRREIAAVAERVFLGRGFAETTMQIIAEEAGASKETLYRHFGSKEELFSTVIRSRSARITGGNEGDLSVEASPRDTLCELGLNLLRFLVSPDSLGLMSMKRSICSSPAMAVAQLRYNWHNLLSFTRN
jgi:TetR/AcrR family transcriptional regulator, mexJK operon transcriptional repressor